jgi:hypothetical protein
MTMKIGRFFIALCIAGMTVLPLAAQDNQPAGRKQSEYYYVNVPLDKIYPYRRGYVVQYRKGVTEQARAYLPLEWFHDAAGKGEVIRLKPGTTWPSLSVYYKNGEFSHVRLYVRREAGHESWGNIPQGVNIDEYFDNVDTIKLEF